MTRPGSSASTPAKAGRGRFAGDRRRAASALRGERRSPAVAGGISGAVRAPGRYPACAVLITTDPSGGQSAELDPVEVGDQPLIVAAYLVTRSQVFRLLVSRLRRISRLSRNSTLRTKSPMSPGLIFPVRRCVTVAVCSSTK